MIGVNAEHLMHLGSRADLSLDFSKWGLMDYSEDHFTSIEPFIRLK